MGIQQNISACYSASQKKAVNSYSKYSLNLFTRQLKVLDKILKMFYAALNPVSHSKLLSFFRASSWSLKSIRRCRFSAVWEYAPLYQEGNFHILVSDGVKLSKEDRKMPEVKKLLQKSENSAKPKYIHGHTFGDLGILARNIHCWAYR